MENYQNTLNKLNGYEKLEVNEKLKHENDKNIEYNCVPLFKSVKSKTKIHRSVSTVKKKKNYKTGELTNTHIETTGILGIFF